MSDKSLLHIYNEVAEKASNVYVVPLIRNHYPTTDYLSLLYKDISDSENISIHSISALAHFRLIAALFTDKNAILHYHWLEFQDWKSAAGIIYKLFCIALFKAFGGKLVWTVHNLYPHNRKWMFLHKKMYRWMAVKADRLLVHTATAVDLVSDEYEIKRDKISVVPHPKFPSTAKTKVEAVTSLNEHFGIKLDTYVTVIGCFGAISAYKRIPEMIKQVSCVSNPKQMLIAGYVKKGMKDIDEQIRSLSNEHDWLFYQPGFISENILPDLMNTIDICVFNFTEILTSGGIEMALAYDKLVLAPKLASLSDYQVHDKVHFFETEAEFIEILTRLTQT